MSFWDLSDGENAAENTSNEYGEVKFDPIPDGSSVLAMIDEIKWDEKNGANFINARWTILSPDEHKNRKVFHKLWVTDDNPNAKTPEEAAKKRDNARRMLAAIDKNAGEKLTKKPGAPTDETLTAYLTNKPMIIRLGVYRMEILESPGEFRVGNWVRAIAPKAAGIDMKEPAPSKRAPTQAAQASYDSDAIPF